MDTDAGPVRSNGLWPPPPPPPRTFQKATPAEEAEAEHRACGKPGAGVTSEAVRGAPGAGLARGAPACGPSGWPRAWRCRGARGFIGVVGALPSPGSTLRGCEGHQLTLVVLTKPDSPAFVPEWVWRRLLLLDV